MKRGVVSVKCLVQGYNTSQARAETQTSHPEVTVLNIRSLKRVEVLSNYFHLNSPSLGCHPDLQLAVELHDLLFGLTLRRGFKEQYM